MQMTSKWKIKIQASGNVSSKCRNAFNSYVCKESQLCERSINGDTCEWPNKNFVEITFGTFCANSVHKYALHIIFLQLQDRVFSFQENPKNLDPSYKTGASCSKHR